MSIAISSFLLIFLAEFGDKSQLVCMVLASRHRKLPVIIGASLAFIILNVIAVFLGAVISQWIPEIWLKLIVIALFVLFGLQALTQKDQAEDTGKEQSHGSVIVTTFLMIFAAELGDKTQLTVAALGASENPYSVYVGATLALILTSTLGALFGSWIRQHIREQTMHRVAGLMFLAFAAWLGYTLLAS